MIVTLAFTVCLYSSPLVLAKPVRCESVELPDEGPLISCIRQAMPTAAAWVEEHHPGWQIIGKLSCTFGEPV